MSNILAIFAEDFVDGRSLFVGQGFDQGILQHIAGIIKPSHVFSQLVVVVPTSDKPIVMVDDVFHRLVDEGTDPFRLTVGLVFGQFFGQVLEGNEELDIARCRFPGLVDIVA